MISEDQEKTCFPGSHYVKRAVTQTPAPVGPQEPPGERGADSGAFGTWVAAKMTNEPAGEVISHCPESQLLLSVGGTTGHNSELFLILQPECRVCAHVEGDTSYLLPSSTLCLKTGLLREPGAC